MLPRTGGLTPLQPDITDNLNFTTSAELPTCYLKKEGFILHEEARGPRVSSELCLLTKAIHRMDLTLNSYAIMQKGNGNKLEKVEGELFFCKKKSI